MDDILSLGKNVQGNNESIDSFLRRFVQDGISTKREKLIWCKTAVKFHSHTFIDRSIKPNSEDKRHPRCARTSRQEKSHILME